MIFHHLSGCFEVCLSPAVEKTVLPCEYATREQMRAVAVLQRFLRRRWVHMYLSWRISLTCCICMQRLQDTTLVPCGHSVCRECLKTMEEKWNTGKCPTCRSSYTMAMCKTPSL